MNYSEACKILEVSEDATEADVKKAYKKLAKKYHPDLNQGNKESEEKFKLINQANDIIAKGPMDESGINMSNFDDIFSQMFGMRGGQRTNMRIFNTVYIDPELLIKGGNLPINIMGKQMQINIDPDTPVGSQISISIPNGQQILQLVPKSTKKYTVTDTIDLTEVYPIDVFKAMMGGELEISSPRGHKLKLKIPPGTQSGSIQRIKGHGLKTPQGSRGNLLIFIEVNIPSYTGTKDEILEKLTMDFTKNTT